MRFLLVALVVAGCGGKESKTDPAPPAPPPPVAAVLADAVVAEAPKPAPPNPSEDAPPPGHDFTPIGQALFVVGACGDGEPPPNFPKHLLEPHCDVISKVQAEYKKDWLDPAKKFFADKVPADLPKKVVYPFAGGDLSTALTVFPDADEITTLSLEPAGDPRTLDALSAKATPALVKKAKPAADKTARTTANKTAKPAADKPAKPADDKPAKPADNKPAKTADDKPADQVAKAAPKKPTGPGALAKALATVRFELDFLYRVNFSNTMNMIDAMRGGSLPTQLIFGLSALKVHGYELVSLRYFKLDSEGAIVYLTDDDVQKAPAIGSGRAALRNRIFANAEVRFRRPGGRTQIYRHMQVNLDDPHMAKDKRALLHLQSKGPIAGMTKAASYLLSWDSFKAIRQYMIENVVWMVSDATGVAPKWGKPAGFEYETYGMFQGPHIGAGNQIWKNWNAEFVAQTKRNMPFRFGYYDKKGANHLVIMRRKKAKA